MVLTLVLAVIMAIIAVAIARYAVTGLRTSEVTTERTVSNTIASAGAYWAIEQFTTKSLQPHLDCWRADTPLAVPTSVGAPGSVTVSCTPQPETDNHRTVLLEAVGVTPDGTSRSIGVLLQVPLAEYTTQVRAWMAD
jgi:hypothetical protein